MGLGKVNTAVSEIVAATRRVIALQAGAAALVAAGFFLSKGKWEAVSVLYGGLISIVIAFLLSRGVVRAADTARQSQKKSMVILYLGAAQRFVLVMVLFGVGLMVFKVNPLATIVGFVAAQLMYVVGMRAGQRPN